MVLSDLLRYLAREGLKVTESQIRWAIRQGRVSRPPMDGSLRFQFREENIAEIVAYFRDRQPEGAAAR